MEKYKIGYTTGVFDMFHVGHLNILKNAKERCEHLIVGVSTDELVKSYKHKTPVIPFEERLAIVESIRYVDEVVPQVSMDKFAAWEKYRFNAIFHGDDWRAEAEKILETAQAKASAGTRTRAGSRRKDLMRCPP